MVVELDQSDAPEVVPVAAEAAEVRRGAGGHRLVLEAVPGVPDVIPGLRDDGRADQSEDRCGDNGGSRHARGSRREREAIVDRGGEPAGGSEYERRGKPEVDGVP